MKSCDNDDIGDVHVELNRSAIDILQNLQKIRRNLQNIILSRSGIQYPEQLILNQGFDNKVLPTSCYDIKSKGKPLPCLFY